MTRVRRSTRRPNLAALVSGAAILFGGAWYFLRHTLDTDMGELDGETLWPILVVALAGPIVSGALRESRDGGTTATPTG